MYLVLDGGSCVDVDPWLTLVLGVLVCVHLLPSDQDCAVVGTYALEHMRHLSRALDLCAEQGDD